LGLGDQLFALGAAWGWLAENPDGQGEFDGHPELVALREQLTADTLDPVRFAECAVCPMRRG